MCLHLYQGNLLRYLDAKSMVMVVHYIIENPIVQILNQHPKEDPNFHQHHRQHRHLRHLRIRSKKDHHLDHMSFGSLVIIKD